MSDFPRILIDISEAKNGYVIRRYREENGKEKEIQYIADVSETAGEIVRKILGCDIE